MNEAELRQALENEYSKVSSIENPVEYTKELTKFLSKLHPSDAHVIIRDNVAPKKNKKLHECRFAKVEAYQEFQDLERRCKESFDHDRAVATNLDVDKAVSKAYGISMRALRAVMDMEKDRFDKVTQAINRIEERLGLDVTDFREGDNNDSTKHEDAQNVEGTTAEAGEPCETE